MYLLSRLPPFSPRVEGLIDASLLTILVFPTLYLFLFHPLLLHITERKEAERLKDELISTVSHELRTPLTSLRGFAELMLKRDFPPEKQREFLTIIHNESLRLANLINDFLDLRHMEAGRQTYNFDSVDMVPLLREAVALFTREGGGNTPCVLRRPIPCRRCGQMQTGPARYSPTCSLTR